MLFMMLSCVNNNNNMVKEFYKDGSLKLEAEMDENGLRNGFYREFYKGGELKAKTKFLKGVNIDTLYLYYKSGFLKEKGLTKKNKKNGWWSYYDSLGNLNKKNEYIFLREGIYKNQTIIYNKDKTINNGLSSYFTINLSDTLELGKNIGEINYNSNFKTDKKYLYILIENKHSNLETKIDTFIEESNYSRFAIFTHQKGYKKIKGRIIEQLIFQEKINKDSAKLRIDEHEKYFEKEVYVK